MYFNKSSLPGGIAGKGDKRNTMREKQMENHLQRSGKTSMRKLLTKENLTIPNMLIAGPKAVLASGKNEGAKWYGKVNTTVFYTVMIILVLFPSIPYELANLMIIVCGGFMCLAFALYARQYKEIRKTVSQL